MRTIITLLISGLSCLALATSPARAEPHVDFVRGDITSMNGNLVRVDTTDIRLASNVVVVLDRKDRPTPQLAVGHNVTAVIENGLATRVEIHTGMAFHGNGPRCDKKEP